MKRQKSQRRQIAVVPFADHQVRAEMFQEGHDQTRRIQAMLFQSAQRRSHRNGRQELVEQLGARGQAQIAAMHNFQIVVGEADGTESQSRNQCDPHEAITEIGPQQRGNHHAHYNQKAAHGWSSGFLLMGFGAVLANVLANLKFPDAANDGRPNDQPDEQCGETGESGAKRKVAEDSERADMKNDESFLIQQPIEQNSSPF